MVLNAIRLGKLMRILSFRGVLVHGYLNFDLRLNEDLTFLTGINGSGKTSVVTAIMALISPSLELLNRLTYSSIEVVIRPSEGNEEVVVSSHRKEESATLEVSCVEGKLDYPLINLVVDEHRYQRSSERDFFEEMENRYKDHPVMDWLRRLPTPMYLDLDRRGIGDSRDPLGMSPRRRRLGRNIFPRSLAESLRTAVSLAEDGYRQMNIKQNRLSDQLRKQLIESAFLIEETLEYGFRLQIPTETDLESIREKRKAIPDLAVALEIEEDSLRASLEPFYSRMEELIERIPQTESVEKILEGEDQEAASALIAWTANRPQLTRVQRMFEPVTKFISAKRNLSREIESYLDLVNRFLQDSKKEIRFDNRGDLVVRNVGKTGTPETLSSGESQIFVIISHLRFNRDAQKANVLIIDEPELSLHVQWQEIFVETLQNANPKSQLILATHSPSIILGRNEFCLDLSKLN